MKQTRVAGSSGELLRHRLPELAAVAADHGVDRPVRPLNRGMSRTCGSRIGVTSRRFRMRGGDRRDLRYRGLERLRVLLGVLR